jgi:type IV secretory pathway TrbL component
MSLRLVSFGLAAAALLVAGAPAFADDATIMDNSQVNIVTGNDNNSANINKQTYSADGYSRGNTGTSMKNGQVNDVEGDRNTSINTNNQGKKTRSSYRR